ncbi:hypothetical protein [Clostridium algidicarnis]|uniref:Uncharacterized protein n=1 Tax=Clostridium algidicarnis TaxID=37659 RepID=A0ABS6C6A8_9CLOT|nr:hypothetical protein [Clostridium algidicarnis]MBU3195021.1 hypothetical protein [Clostridium algidicarnis]MBU3221021.1 hypothetical protein [Clostridium algidicarnis]MCB2287504.1 hypothetical protein [Clostridium algidicarnis]
MKKNLLIFILILVSIILTLFLRNYIRDKVNERVIKKYEIILEENLIFDMDISEATYKIARTYDLLPTDIHTNISHELQNETITKEIFSKYSKEVNVNNKSFRR